VTLATLSAAVDGLSGQLCIERPPIEGLFGRRRVGTKEFPGLSELGGTLSVGQYSKSPDANEPTRQNVEQETANELVGFECHSTHDIAGSILTPAIVLPAESNLAVFQTQEAMVGNGHFVGVTTEIVHDLFGPAKRPFGIDDPFYLAQFSQEPVEHLGLGEFLELAVKLQLFLVVGVSESGHEKPAIESRENPYREKELLAPREPALPIKSNSAAGNDAVNVRVSLQVLTPGVKNG
jgi:hypothetical protein